MDKSKNCPCDDCKQNCPAKGCVLWREWFIANWNRYICRIVQGVFRHEHPDLVREGIVWTWS